MIEKLVDWLDLRVGIRRIARGALDEPISGGARMMYVFGSVVLFLLILQFVTGVLLAFYYSPSATDAWGSVAYIEDQVAFGWLVRGLHHHGASAIVIACALHLFQTALYGAYKKPREVNWIIGVLLLGLILAFALTGYLLPWDQTGYWATKVATGIAGETPLLGDQVREVAQGGNEYGNLTLTRFFALHVLVLPAITAVLVVAHVALFRKHGVTPRWNRKPDDLARTTTPFWPDQLFRDMAAMAIAFAALIAWTVWQGGARLDAPADPSSAFDARPEWYFRALFQLLKYFEGPAETIAALGVPAIVGALLVGLPFVDRGPDRDPRKRVVPLAILGALAVGAGVLTFLSFKQDGDDPALEEREAAAAARAGRARALARANGVPVAGGTAVFATAKFYRARTLWETRCADCHDADRRKPPVAVDAATAPIDPTGDAAPAAIAATAPGPVIGPGYNNRAWIRAFLTEPSGDTYFGHTALSKSDAAMAPVEQTGAELDALVELVYAESGASDVDAAKVAAGRTMFEDACGGCHTLEPGATSDGAPTLVGRGSRDYLIALIDDPGDARFFAVGNQMPALDLDRSDRAALADWLIYLRTATAADVAALPPLD